MKDSVAIYSKENVSSVLTNIYRVTNLLSQIDSDFDGKSYLYLYPEPEDISLMVEMYKPWVGSCTEYVSFPMEYLGMENEEILSAHKNILESRKKTLQQIEMNNPNLMKEMYDALVKINKDRDSGPIPV